MENSKSRLIKLAAEILVTDSAPSPDIEDHEHAPKRVPALWWREMCAWLLQAKEDRRRWAVELKKIADDL